jgi:hypothetical protein
MNDILTEDDNNLISFFNSTMKDLNIKLELKKNDNKKNPELSFLSLKQRHKIIKAEIPLKMHWMSSNSKVSWLWNEFQSIYEDLSNDIYENGALVQPRTREWLTKFIEKYTVESITPYMHLMTSHMSDFKNNPNFYNLQGLEKLNDFTTTDYAHVTNRWKDSLKQILLHRLRVETLDVDYKKKETSKEKCLDCGLLFEEVRGIHVHKRMAHINI